MLAPKARLVLCTHSMSILPSTVCPWRYLTACLTSAHLPRSPGALPGSEAAQEALHGPGCGTGGPRGRAARQGRLPCR